MKERKLYRSLTVHGTVKANYMYVFTMVGLSVGFRLKPWKVILP